MSSTNNLNTGTRSMNGLVSFAGDDINATNIDCNTLETNNLLVNTSITCASATTGDVYATNGTFDTLSANTINYVNFNPTNIDLSGNLTFLAGTGIIDQTLSTGENILSDTGINNGNSLFLRKGAPPSSIFGASILFSNHDDTESYGEIFPSSSGQQLNFFPPVNGFLFNQGKMYIDCNITNPAFYTNPLTTITPSFSETTYSSGNWNTNVNFLSLTVPAYNKKTINLYTRVAFNQTSTIATTTYTPSSAGSNVAVGTSNTASFPVSAIFYAFTIGKGYAGTTRIKTPISYKFSSTYQALNVISPSYSLTLAISSYVFKVYKDGVLWNTYTALLDTNTAGSLTKSYSFNPPLTPSTATTEVSIFASDFYCDIVFDNQQTNATYEVYFEATFTSVRTFNNAQTTTYASTVYINTTQSTASFTGTAPLSSATAGTAYSAVGYTNTPSGSNQVNFTSQFNIPSWNVYKNGVFYTTITPSVYLPTTPPMTKSYQSTAVGSQVFKTIYCSIYTTGFTTDYTIYDDVYDFYYNGNFTTTLASNNLQADSLVYQILINATSLYNTLTNCSLISSSGLPTGNTTNQLQQNLVNDTTTTLVSNNQICNNIDCSTGISCDGLITSSNASFYSLRTRQLYFNYGTIDSTSGSHYVLGNQAGFTTSCFYIIYDNATQYIDLTALGEDYDGMVFHIRSRYNITKNYYSGSGLYGTIYFNLTGGSGSPDSRSAYNQTFIYLHNPTPDFYPTWYMINNV